MKLIFIVSIFSLLLGAISSVSANSFVITSTEQDEFKVKVYEATLPDDEKPIVIWFTEAYTTFPPYLQMVTHLNDAGFTVWQVDLLDAYFLERTKANVRSLQGNGVAAVLDYANQQGKPFILSSTGRMSLALLRGVRLWQLDFQPENGLGNLEQVVTFFPNIYEATEKAGDKPSLYPAVSASSLPITIVQVQRGRYTLKIEEMIEGLEQNGSQVTVVRVPEVRDWYFLKSSPNEIEVAAAAALPNQLIGWLTASKVPQGTKFKPAAEMAEIKVPERRRGVIPVEQREAPNFTLTDIHNKSIEIADKRGKVVLLNFWASWCPPCVVEIPSMNRLAGYYDSNDFEIVSVNFKETPEVIESFLTEVDVDFPVLIDLDGKVSAKYQIFSFPSSFLIDKQGQIRYSVNSAIEWDDEEVKDVINSMIK